MTTHLLNPCDPPNELALAALHPLSRWHEARCPWCKSTDRNVRLDVPALKIHCYNDWHFPLCVCGKTKYAHGYSWTDTYTPVPAPQLFDHAKLDSARLAELEDRSGCNDSE